MGQFASFFFCFIDSAEEVDNHLSAIQRDHEQLSLIEEKKIRDAAALKEAKRREKALMEEKMRQEKAKADEEVKNFLKIFVKFCFNLYQIL